MKLFKILLILGVLLGGVIGSVVEVESFAASPVYEMTEGEGYTINYFPSTGYAIESVCFRWQSIVGKYVLPKNLSLSKLKALRGKFPGVNMSMYGKNIEFKPMRWVKKWQKLSLDGSFHTYNVNNNPSGLIKYINNTKFDNIYAKGLATYRSHNTTIKNQELLWTNRTNPKENECAYN